jgi:Phage capsid scaffolding protein (GPO) serine peptidase
MKTKPFLLATAGSTVDGRTIDDKLIDEMASSYDPKTYGARLNIEHLRGISPDGPFKAYGDVVELSVGEIDVNFNGKTEKRKALYGVFDVTDDAKKMNDAGQKLYPSIEITSNFAGKDFAYLTGCALTDSPASIATEQMKFNRTMPGTITVNATEAAALEFADEDGKTSDDGKSFLKSLTGVLEGFATKFGPAKADDKPEPKADNKSAAFTADDIKGLFTAMATETQTALTAIANSNNASIDALVGKFTALEAKIEGTPSKDHSSRPLANGQQENLSKVF